MSEGEEISRREHFRALVRIARYRPTFTAAIVIAGIFGALLEGVGLSFILPIIEIVQAPGDPAEEADGLMLAFVTVYEMLDVPLTLGFVIAGVGLVLTVRWTVTFFVRWLREALVIDYTRAIQKQAFDNALDARIEYFDQEGSDDILNAIVTQAEYAARTIRFVVVFLEYLFLSLMYLLVAFVLAPLLTIFTVVFLGGFTVLFRYVLEPGYDLGDEVADANERIQESAQAGTQGIRDTKLFGLKSELFDDFLEGVNQFASSSIKLRRNEEAINSYYNLLTSVSVFVLIFFAVAFVDLSLGALGIFLFAMLQLGPTASRLNRKLYQIENNLPHLVRTQQFIDELKRNREPVEGNEATPEEIHHIEFDNVHYSYPDQENDAVSGLSLEFEKGEFIGFAGQSGAGKSTIVSLLTRMYEPSSGEIRANGRSIQNMEIDDWRSKIAVVRQNSFIFNDTLRYNLTIGNRDTSEKELDHVSNIAKIDEFFDSLPDGYETHLGDEGVQLSGGQKQRVALARALLKKEADILVLDEATSDLDSDLERQIQGAIENMQRDYAVLSIAHRLSTIENADRIYTVDNGYIVECGKHSELLENDGKYAKLYRVSDKNAS